MMGTRGAAAKVETKQVKNDIHDKWNVRMWGLPKEKSLNTLALCSESTGKSKLAVVSVGTIGEATDEAKAGSLPVTPCMELPGDPSMSLIVTQKYYQRNTSIVVFRVEVSCLVFIVIVVDISGGV